MHHFVLAFSLCVFSMDLRAYIYFVKLHASVCYFSQASSKTQNTKLCGMCRPQIDTSHLFLLVILSLYFDI